nr:hypothetical protein [Tanacetum cinerariifolium]
MFLLDYNRFQTLHSYNEAPPSPDYVPGPEYPPSPEFVPKPVYPEFMPAEDDILPNEEQPLPAVASLATESDPNEDPEEDPADYPADGGDEGDDEDESSDDDEDDDIDIEGDEEKDEYLDHADSTVVALPTIDHAPSAEETEPPQTPISLPSDTEIARLMAIPTLPPSPLSPLSSTLPQIPSPPLPLLSPPPTDPTYEEAPLGYRVARLRLRSEREEILKADLLLRKRLCTTHTGTYELGLSSAAAAARLRKPVMDDLYMFVDTVERGEGSTPAFMESIDASDAARSEVITLRTQVSAQRTEIADLRAADCKFQTIVGTQHEEIRKLRAAHRNLQAQFIRALTALKSCQTQLTAAL